MRGGFDSRVLLILANYYFMPKNKPSSFNTLKAFQLAFLLLLITLFLTSISYFLNLFGLRTYLQASYHTYLYNLPKNVARRAEEARIAQELANLQTQYLDKLSDLDLLLTTYNQNDITADMASVSANVWQETIRTLIFQADFVAAEQKLDDYKKNIEAVALLNSQTYYSKKLDIINQKLANFKKKLQSKDLERLSVLEQEIVELIGLANFDQVTTKLVEYDQQASLSQSSVAQSANSASVESSATISNVAPSNGFASQIVMIDNQKFSVKLIAANLSQTKVIVDTASSEDCQENCPVLSLADYVSRNGAFAGINGSYFMPYNGSNSYDLLVMNKDKKCFNQDNNVYSVNPLAVFHQDSIEFRSGGGWSCDQSANSALMNYPMLLKNGEVDGNFNDQKVQSASNRSFVGNQGSTVYIGVVYGATSIQAGQVLKTLGLENALGLDAGGSTALWSNGRYQVGPGRNLPNAILFVNK